MVEISKHTFKLRPFRAEDAKTFHDGINTAKVAADTTIPIPWPLDSISWWIGFINDAASRNPISELHFVIEIGDNLAGSIGIINIDGHKCEIGYWLKEEYYSKGIMTNVVREVTDYAFKNLAIKRIFAPVLTHNKASARLLEKNDFIKEGVLKSYYFKDGKYIDALCYAKTAI